MTNPQDDSLALPVVTTCSEIVTAEAFAELLTSGVTNQPLAVQGLDLCEFSESILQHEWTRAVFLGCQMHETAAAHARGTGASVFPPFSGLPYNPYRGCLYSPDELRADGLDTAIYEHQVVWRNEPPAPILEALAQRFTTMQSTTRLANTSAIARRWSPSWVDTV